MRHFPHRLLTQGILAPVCLVLAGCSSINIHRELRADDTILRREWTLSTRPPSSGGNRGSEHGSVVRADRTLFVSSSGVGIQALYPGILQTRWTAVFKGGVTSPITESRGTLYFQAGDGNFYALDAESGKQKWQLESHFAYASKPTVHQGRVLFTTPDDSVWSVDMMTGQKAWVYRRKSAATSVVQRAAQPVVDGDNILIGLSDGYVVSLGSKEGNLIWERRLNSGSRMNDVDANAIVSDGHIFMSAYDGAFYTLNKKSGDIQWKVDGGGARTPLLQPNRIVVPGSDGIIRALDPESGKELWKFALDGGTPTEVIAIDQSLAVGSSYRYLYVLDAETGRAVYRFDCGDGSGITAPLTYDPETRQLYVLTSSGNLMSFYWVQTPKK